MNICPKCKVTLKTNSTTCPLCHNKIELKKHKRFLMSIGYKRYFNMI